MAGSPPTEGNQEAKSSGKKKGRADARYVEIAIVSHVICGEKRKYQNRGKRKQEPGTGGRRRAIVRAVHQVDKEHEQRNDHDQGKPKRTPAKRLDRGKV